MPQVGGGDAVGGDGNGAAHLERLLARHRRGGEEGRGVAVGCQPTVMETGRRGRSPGEATRTHG